MPWLETIIVFVTVFVLAWFFWMWWFERKK
jgi:hypothetical protein